MKSRQQMEKELKEMYRNGNEATKESLFEAFLEMASADVLEDVHSSAVQS